MNGTSREALTRVQYVLRETLSQQSEATAVGIRIGSDVFGVVDVIDGDRALKIALADTVADVEARKELADKVFSSAISSEALLILERTVTDHWSSPKDLIEGLIILGREAMFLAAEAQDQLSLVEEELFRLGRIIAANTELEQALRDPHIEVSARRDLLARVLYGKVTAITEALVSQSLKKSSGNLARDIDDLANMAASIRGCAVANVISAIDLTDSQRERLLEKLQRMYNHKFSLHIEVDRSLEGGMEVRIGSVLIDGSFSSRLAKIRRGLS